MRGNSPDRHQRPRSIRRTRARFARRAEMTLPAYPEPTTITSNMAPLRSVVLRAANSYTIDGLSRSDHLLPRSYDASSFCPHRLQRPARAIIGNHGFPPESITEAAAHGIGNRWLAVGHEDSTRGHVTNREPVENLPVAADATLVGPWACSRIRAPSAPIEDTIPHTEVREGGPLH